MAPILGKNGSDGLREHLKAHGTPPFQLSAPVRGRILSGAREARRAAGEGFSLQRFPVVSLTAAAVAFLILSAGLTARMPGHFAEGPILLNDGARTQALPEAEGQNSNIWVDYRDTQVILTWKAAEGRPVTVKRGTGLMEARKAPPLLVKGDTLVQEDAPGPNEAIFYVVE